jgi:hypothetical protein
MVNPLNRPFRHANPGANPYEDPYDTRVARFDQTKVVKGSLTDVMGNGKLDLADAIMEVEAVVIVDVSGSMDAHDSVGGKRRYDVACEELERLQNKYPGKVAVVAFSDEPAFCPDGVPTWQGGGTRMRDALEFAQVVDDAGLKFILISDGCPDDRQGTIEAAKSYKSTIDVIYVGPEDEDEDHGGDWGRKFLTELSEASGGEFIASNNVGEDFMEKIEILMLPEKAGV